MAIMVEGEKRPELTVNKVPDEIELPEHLVEVKPVPANFKATPEDNKQNLIQTPENRDVTITLPADTGTLEKMSKGSGDDSSTGWSVWWLRAVKRAFHFGWKIVTGGNNVS